MYAIQSGKTEDELLVLGRNYMARLERRGEPTGKPRTEPLAAVDITNGTKRTGSERLLLTQTGKAGSPAKANSDSLRLLSSYYYY